MRKWAAVPVLSAEASCHVPDFAFDPDAAAAIQSDGSAIVASTVPASAAAQFAGAAPLRISRDGEAPTVDSIASRRALRTASESCRAILVILRREGGDGSSPRRNNDATRSRAGGRG